MVRRTAVLIVGILAIGGTAGRLYADDKPAARAASPGKTLFEKKCSLCHADGHGNEKMAGMLHTDPAKMNLTKSQATPDQITKILATGRNKMPSFKYLTADQIKDLTAYVISLRAKQPQLPSRVE
ncbi:MAG TPA: cytochrome c [Elusimicrobiota bacterium]|nr:cytochrome c [Elusimicrobiota bacterium]